jgi:hypothetical protein
MSLNLKAALPFHFHKKMVTEFFVLEKDFSEVRGMGNPCSKSEAAQRTYDLLGLGPR